MSTNLVLTVIGNDRPGLVEELSTAISAHQGNWLEASMSHLAGQFAGIVRVELPDAHAAPLQAALRGLADLQITTATSSVDTNKEGRTLLLSLVGHDRIGIVREVTQVLARHAVNVEKLTTYTASAPCRRRRCSTPTPNCAPHPHSTRGRSRQNWKTFPTT